MTTNLKTLGVVLPASALVYGSLLGDVADALQARSAPPDEARQALQVASVAAGALIVAAAATQGPASAIGSLVVVGLVGLYWHRFVL